MVNLKNIEHNLKPLKKLLEKIKAQDLSGLQDRELVGKSAQLKTRLLAGAEVWSILPEAYALVGEAVTRTLGFQTHDNQLLAAIAMARGDIIELATGEGKTLAAVFPAYLMALGGKGVHVLTFNDYLAERDALWMSPVYSILGLTVGFITEGVTAPERHTAYMADVTYVTAKEAGFDYLRGFLAFDETEIVQRPFHFAIIDEADSILIDEARVPMVIAGDELTVMAGEPAASMSWDRRLLEIVVQLQPNFHFSMDDNNSVVFLEDAGIDYIEKALNVGSLYEEHNLELLSKLQLMLQAHYLLKRDVDYIVRNGEIQLVDEFTGRVAKNRQWSDGLHAAVEMKEGLTPLKQGLILNRITLQSLLRLYPDFCGMTGTACPAASEFHQFYNKYVTVIPPHQPCRRIDRPDDIFTHCAAKYDAIVAEVIETHRTGRPILIGTSSVEESEKLASLLCGSVPGLKVLNAKNDTEEAAVIAQAGQLNAVTISTNMAGRGVDIRLGGESGDDYDKICTLGGLYILGTARHESVRVDNQLRGRAGRQGDHGESKLMISLEDALVVKYGLAERLPEQYRTKAQESRISSHAVRQAMLRTQRYVEAEAFDAKVTLFKYAQLVEDQRRLVHTKRMDILTGCTSLAVLEKLLPERYAELTSQVSQTEFLRAQQQIELYALGKSWAEHLLFTESLSDEIYVRGKVRGDPLMNYHQRLIDGFQQLQDNVSRTIVELFEHATVKDGVIDLELLGVKGPTSTRTYMVHDGTEGLDRFGAVGELAGMGLPFAFYFLSLLLEKLKKK